VHAVLALALLQTRHPARAPLPEAIEIAISAQEPRASVDVAGHAEPAGVSAPSNVPPARDKRSRVVARAEAERAETGAPTAPAAEATPAATEPTPAAEGVAARPGETNRLATLLPAHPDLSAAGRLGVEAGQPRDLLAPPTLGPKPVPPRELPEVLRGGGGVTAQVEADGTLRFHDSKNLGYDARAWSGRFDVTDALMRKRGQDPYASIKRQLADETREQRICMGKQAQEKRQREALVELSARVRQIARRTDLPLPERRQIVFELWDECLEGPGDPSLDYGGMARAIVLSVIRDVFPAGSELAYQPAELLALNRRRSSHEPFAPYETRTATPRSATGGAFGSTSCP